MDNIGVFGTFGRKTLAIMLICIGDGIRDSLINKRTSHDVSIHTPTWGVTVIFIFFLYPVIYMIDFANC